MNSVIGQQASFEKINEVCEQLTLVTDLFACIMQECPQAIRKDACDTMLYFSHQAIENLKRGILSGHMQFQLAYQVLAEQIIFSALTTVASFIGNETQEQVRQNQLDEVFLARGTQILKAILQLVPSISGVFFRNLSYPYQRHYIQNVGVFRQINRKSKPRTLLKIVLKTVNLATQRWQEKLKTFSQANNQQVQVAKEQTKVYENYQCHLLEALDKVACLQIQYYLRTEANVQVQAAMVSKDPFEPKPQLVHQRSQKSQKSQKDMDAIEERDSEGESDKEGSDYVESQESQVRESQKSDSSPSNQPWVKHTSIQVLNDAHIAEGFCNLDETRLAKDESVQQDWVSINSEVFEITRRLLPLYYKDINKQRDEVGLEQNYTSIGIENERSYLSHICDLFKIQFYFCLRHNDYNTHAKYVKTSRPFEMKQDGERDQCNLTMSIKMFFQMISQNEIEYNKSVLAQIYDVCRIIEEKKAYHVVDPNHFLQLYWLEYMTTKKLGQLVEPNPDAIDEQSMELFQILYKSFKSFFIEDKYLYLLESVFELDPEQLCKIESEFINEQDDLKIYKLNRFVIQRHTMILLVQMCSNNYNINRNCWDRIRQEFAEEGMCYAIGNTQGDLYEEIVDEIRLPQHKGNIETHEFRHKTTRSVFKTEIYMFIKLAIGLLGQQMNSRMIYHTLIESQHHFEAFHKDMHPIRLQQKGTSQAEIRLSEPPKYQDQLNFNGDAQKRSCEDCLRCQFKKFKLNKTTQLTDLSDFWKFIFDRIKSLSAALRQQELLKEEFFNPEAIDTKKAAQVKKSDGITKRTYKIAEKIYSILKRFIIFASQNKQISHYLIELLYKKPDRDEGTLSRQQQKNPKNVSRGKPRKEEPEGPKILNQQDFRSIQDEAFKLLLLRNFIFNTRFGPPELSEHCTFLIDQLAGTARTIKWNWNVLVKYQEVNHSKDRERTLMQQVFDNFITQDPLANERKALKDLQNKNNAFGQTRDQWLEEKTQRFRETADICNSVISLYINVVAKSQQSLLLFKRKPTVEVTLLLLRKVVFAEGSFAVEFIAGLLQAFFKEQVEDVDPFKLTEATTLPTLMIRNTYTHNNNSVMHSNLAYQEHLLKLIFDSLVEFIRITKEDLTITLDARKDFKQKAVQMVKFAVGQLKNRMFDHVHSSFFALKFQNSLKRESLNQIKKIFIFLREQGQASIDEYGRDVHQTEQTISQFKQIIVKTLSVMPKPQQIRDFFAFLREILHYRTKLDEVDYLLTGDMLQILNDVLRKKSAQLSQECVNNGSSGLNTPASLVLPSSSQQLKLTDSFMFSKYTPGMLILNNFILDKEPHVSLLFKVDQSSIVQEMKQDGKKEFEMVIMSLMLKYDPSDPQNLCGKTIDVKLKIILKEKSLLQFSLSASTFDAESPPLEYRDLDNLWHFLLLKFTKRAMSFAWQLEVYLDSLEHQSKSNLIIPLRNIDTSLEYYVALGNNVDTLQKYIQKMKHIQAGQTMKRSEESKSDDPGSLIKEQIEREKDFNRVFDFNNQYFRGQVSLPFFFKTNLSSVHSNSFLAQAFRDQVIEFISTKNVLNFDGQLDLGFQVFKLMDRMNQGAKSQNLRQIASESTDEKLQQQYNKNKSKDDQKVRTFTSIDRFTMQVAHLHTLAYQQRILTSVHARMPAEVFMCLGGFKNLYPLVDNILNSNLSQLCQLKPGLVLSWVFEILNTLLHTEPAHIHSLVKSKNLLMTLKMILLELGSKQMISVTLIAHVRNIIKKNVLARFRFVQVNGNGIKHSHYQQPYINTANGTIRASKPFYEGFLLDFFNQVLLDKDLAIQSCFYLNNPQVIPAQTKNSNSTTLSSKDPHLPPPQLGIQINSHLVIEEIIELVSFICCPPDTKLFTAYQHRNERQQISADAYTDYHSLREIIIQDKTTKTLIDLLNLKQLQHIKHTQLLTKLGKCIADSIIFKEDTESLKTLLAYFQKDEKWRELSPLLLKVYLLILLKVLKETNFANKESGLTKVLAKDFVKQHIAKILNQTHPKELVSDETLELQDEVISIAILILVQHYINLKKEQQKPELIDKVSQHVRKADKDPDRGSLMTLIKQELNQNLHLKENTYYTLMLVAFEKRKVSELPFNAIPKIDDIVTIIKKVHLKQDNYEQFQVQRSTSTFDIDFFFVVLELFRKYNSWTKRNFLSHIHLFLKTHNHAFMSIFEEVSNIEAQFKNMLLGFFQMIISECITSTDRDISLSAELILLEVCSQQLRSSQFDTMPQQSSFITTNSQQRRPRLANALGSHDYQGTKLVTVIFLLFKNDNNQFTVLKNLLHKVGKESFSFDETKNEKDRRLAIKLNMKLIQLLQVIESIFINKPSIATNQCFIQALAVMMYLLNKMKIMDFALPDIVCENFYPVKKEPERNESVDVSFNLLAQQASQIKNQPQAPSSARQVPSTQARALADLGMPMKNAQMVVQKEDLKVLPEVKVKPDLNQSKRSQSRHSEESQMFEFINGGSLRILLHIILSSIYSHGNQMMPSQFATYVDLLRFLMTREINHNLSQILLNEKQPYYEDQFADAKHKQGEFKLKKVNLLNKAEVQNFILTNDEKAQLYKESNGFIQNQQNVNSALSNDGSNRSLKNILSPEQYKNLSKSTWQRDQDFDKTFQCHDQTFDGIKDTIQAQFQQQRDKSSLVPDKSLASFNEDRQIKNNQNYLLNLGYTKIIKPFLPGAGIVKGFCTTMLIGELVEVLHSLVNPDDERQFDINLQTRMKNSASFRRFASPKNAIINFSMQSIAETESENQPDDMTFEETKAHTQSASFKQNSRNDIKLLSNCLSREGTSEKVDELLRLLYELLNEQLFEMPLSITQSSFAKQEIRIPNRSFRNESREPIIEDLSKDAGRIFWDAIDSVLREKFKAELDFYSQNKWGYQEAKKKVTFICCAKQQETVNPLIVPQKDNYFNKLRKQSTTGVDMANLFIETNQNLMMSSDNAQTQLGHQFSDLASDDPRSQDENQTDFVDDSDFDFNKSKDQVIDERMSFVKDFMEQKKDSAFQSDNHIKKFVTHLFSMLHGLYGKDTKIVVNEFGGFELRHQDSGIINETDFSQMAKKNNYTGQLIEVIDFLNKNELVSVSFVGVSSDLFKNDLKTAFQIAKRIQEKQQMKEKQFEQTRSETQGRKSGMSLDISLNKQIFSSQQFEPNALKQFETGAMKLPQEMRKFNSDEKALEQPANQNTNEIIQFKDDESAKIPQMSGLDYLYTKKQFNRIVKWCSEDPSNIWYDHMEQALADFAEARQIYKSQVLGQGVETAETQRQKHFKNMLEIYNNDKSVQENGEKKTKLQLFNDYKTNYGEIYVNPQFHNCFVKQRQQIDKWGRKLLTKPNRKYDQGEAWQYYKFVGQDYLNKMFAVSLLEDADQNDCVIAQSDHDTMLQIDQDAGLTKNMSLERNYSQPAVQSEPQMSFNEVTNELSYEPLEVALKHYDELTEEPEQPKQFSKNLQRLRNDLFTRLDRNRLLQSVIFAEHAQPVSLKPQTEEEKKEERDTFINAIRLQEKLRNRKMKVLADSNNGQLEQTDYFKIFEAIQTQYFMFYGNIITTPDYLCFFSFGLQTQEMNYFMIQKDWKLDVKKQIIFRWGEIEELLVRPCYGPMIGLEVYTCHKKHYSFDLITTEHLKEFLQVVKTYKQQGKFSFNIVDEPVDFFRERGFAEAWKNQEKSNQEFLLLLNKYSGRTFNGHTQYPFFPHILMDFSSNLLEFHEKDSKHKVFRDLKKNTLCIVPAKEKWFEEQLSQSSVKTQEGTLDAGYQIKVSQGYVGGIRTIQSLHRLEPFSSWYLGINGKMESDDRLYYDSNELVEQLSCLDQQGTNTELNPEFFYLPEILTNENYAHFGQQHKNKDQWYLPRWALNHYDMVRIFRESLESKYVRNNLGSWIDLIFGCDQFSAAKFNQFYPWQYPEWWKKEKMYEEWQKQRRENEDIQEELTNGQYELPDEFGQMEIATAYTLQNNGYQVPLKLFSEPIMQAEKEKPQATDQDFQIISDTRMEEEKLAFDIGMTGKKGAGMLNIDNLINHFVNNFENPTRSDLKLNRCADYQVLDHNHDIVHQIIISLKKECLAFLRIEDKKVPKEILPKAVPTGKIVVYKSRVNISKDTFLPKDQKDLQLRYEHVHHELENIFAEFSCKHEKCTYKERGHLYVCGYLDNSIKIFDLMIKSPGKPLIKELRMNNARVTCIKFSKDCKYLITCDADGVIHHFEKNCHLNDYADVDAALNTTVGPSVQKQAKKDGDKAKEHFPFTLLHVIQDQMDEIVALDINETLDMYVTISRDGTIALRCLRTSKLWRHFKILYRNESKQTTEDGKTFEIKGYIKNFVYISALKLSLHGYIFVCGPISRTPGISQYMVYSLNGDLLRAALEKVEIKNVFLNSREDQIIIATNYVDQKDSNKDAKQPKNVKSNVRVLSLYGLDRVANLTKIVYSETKNFLEQQNENGTEIISEPTSRETPSIQSMAIGLGERNINIFYVKKNIDAKGVIRQVKNENKEIICFDSGMDAVWSHFKNYGIAR